MHTCQDVWYGALPQLNGHVCSVRTVGTQRDGPGVARLHGPTSWLHA